MIAFVLGFAVSGGVLYTLTKLRDWTLGAAGQFSRLNLSSAVTRICLVLVHTLKVRTLPGEEGRLLACSYRAYACSIFNILGLLRWLPPPCVAPVDTRGRGRCDDSDASVDSALDDPYSPPASGLGCGCDGSQACSANRRGR